MKYDVEGDRVEWRAQPSGAIVTNEYDSRSELVRRTSTGGAANSTRLSIRSGLGVLAEYEGAPSILASENVYANDRLIANIAGESVTYNHHDHLSVRVITDASGSVVRERGHYPFGEVWYSTGSGMSDDPWVFTSYYRDEDTGSDNAIAREFVPGEGRFDSPDPFGGDPRFPQTLNRYSYSLNDPVNLVDPSGELCYGWHVFVTYAINGVVVGREYLGFIPVRCLAEWATLEQKRQFAETVARQLFDDALQFQQLRDCINVVFGRDARKAWGHVDPRRPPLISFESKEPWDTLRENRDSTPGITKGWGVPTGRGIVHMNPNLIDASIPYVRQSIMGTYVHEYGNILDAWLNPYTVATKGSYQRNYGRSEFRDDDTGQALEDCFYAGVGYELFRGAVPTP